MTKRLSRITVVLALVLSLVITSAASVFATAPAKEKVSYKGSGRVEVEFTTKVYYKNTKVVVKDTSGKKYTTTITDRDDDEIDFRVKNYKTGKKYNFTIYNVKKRGTSKYGDVKGSFTIKKASSKPVIEKVSYEGYGVVEVEFKSDVYYKSSSVTVKDQDGKSYSARIIERDDDEMSFRLGSHKKGVDYSFKISGIKKRGSSSYTSVSGSFSIPAEQTGEQITATQAKEIAINDAVTRYSIVKDSALVYSCEQDREAGVVIWDVDFEAEDSNGYVYEFEYEIYAVGGAIKHYERDFD